MKKYIKKLCVSVAAVLCLQCVLLTGCGQGTQTMEILLDTNFQNGFGVMAGELDMLPDHDIYSYGIVKELKHPANPDASFDWRIAQWKSVHSFSHELQTVETEDYVSFENAAKQVRVFNDGSLQLNCFSSQEYSAPRKSGEGWVHLLIEQVLHGKQRVHFENMKHLYMEAEFTVNFCDNKMQEGTYDKSLHAGHLVWYITVENELSNSVSQEGRPDYLWFGVPIGDSRGRDLDKNDNYFLDKGTKKLIYSLGSGKFFSESEYIFGKTYKIKRDVLPDIRKAFDIAKENDFLPDAVFEHMVIGSTNFGWEMPGTFDGGMTLHNISINYE